MKQIHQFLSNLGNNNNKEWFDENRKEYKKCRDKVITFTHMLIHEIREFDNSIPMLDASKCIFRINRDTRFSNNKQPYKTNFGIFITPKGKNKASAGYYLHIEPGNSFVGGGIYCPPSPALKAIRSEIYENSDDFIAIINDKQFKNRFSSIIDEDMLKKSPRGFDKDWEHIDLLKYKHYTVIEKLSDEHLFDENLFMSVIECFRDIYSFNQFLNYAIDEHE